MFERTLTDGRQVEQASGGFLMTLDGGVHQLARICEVPVQGSQRQTRSPGRLLDGGEHRVLPEHLEHDVQNRIPVALPAGDPAVRRLIGFARFVGVG